ncbi:DNA helicase RecQ [Sphaerobacter sp.]|uniref:DNA helicase RecQ n=1 Tax=Sphaerobacter sp. TaxID=2099654 RepID=UPI001D6A3893|nr:DNA helicase RecQ [Sphaerobacter sp.]MBX5444709.1 DNA helicase RecQ [Sphaerobacter sp.]
MPGERSWTDDELRAALRSTFGHEDFRPLQLDVVRAILQGRDVFVLMPTGGGKSLCYQLPSLLLDGMTVVVSPLIALMKDQVDQLTALGVAATYINSALDPDEIRRRQAAVARGEVKLLYVAPERLMTSPFLRLLEETRLAFLAIDEAHCISEWGRDFRPEYRQLRALRERFPATPLGAFTATATKRVQADIVAQLGLTAAAMFQGSYNRPNLVYAVRPKDNVYARLLDYLRARPEASGIIYCHTRAGVDELAERLRADGILADGYHAGLDADERRRRQEAFRRDEIRVMVATVAFGMGIDKPDVRFVIHVDAPRSLERYYQESGRAGRDGEPADCILFYSRGDIIRYERLIQEIEGEQERRVALEQLRRVRDWAEGLTCRRAGLLAYFDEPYDGGVVPCCDVCDDPPELRDYTIPAQMFLSCVYRTRQRFGADYVIQVLRGSRAERVLRNRHDQLSTYGIGADRPADEWRYLARELVSRGYLRQDPSDFNALKITERGRAVLRSEERVVLPAPRTAAPPPKPVEEDVPHPELVARLKALRKEMAVEREVPPYVIFFDRTLHRIAAALPQTRDALLAIPGLGRRKVEDFGQRIVDEVTRYVRETGAEPVDWSPPAPAQSPRRPRALGNSARQSLELFRQGYTVAEIAERRGLAVSTIEGHLAEALEMGEDLDLDQIVAPERRRVIAAAFAELGTSALTPVREYLGDGYSYFELRMVRAALSRAR